MKTLTDEECSEWLASRKLVEDPYYSAKLRPLHYEQYRIPSNASGSSAMIRSIVECLKPFETVLLQVTDWALYQPDEMAVVAQIRGAIGEQRPLIASPGHVLDATERDLLIGFLALITSFGWTAYLYFDHGTTLFSWEGELLDFYASDLKPFQAVGECMQGMSILSSVTGISKHP